MEGQQCADRSDFLPLRPPELAGFPTTSSVATVNRQCSSGLVAVNHIALMISDGQIDMGIGAGVESMSQNYGAGVMPEKVSALCFPARMSDSH